MVRRVKTWKWRSAQRLSLLLDRLERLAGRRFYELHLEASALRHRRGSKILELTVAQKTVKFRTPSAKALWRAQTLLEKEPATIHWIDTFEPGDVLWDIGANVGIYSIYAGVVKNVAVLAFEPAAFNYALLCDNIRLNNLEDRASAYCLAFSECPRLGQLRVADDEPGAAIASVEAQGIGLLKQAVPIFSVDDFIQHFVPPFPTHIKIDVDGVESEILDGARRTFADQRLRSLLVEVDERDGSRPEHIDAVLDEVGFRLIEVHGSPLAPNSASRNRIYRRANS